MPNVQTFLDLTNVNAILAILEMENIAMVGYDV
jgi:hypothetical protein